MFHVACFILRPFWASLQFKGYRGSYLGDRVPGALNTFVHVVTGLGVNGAATPLPFTLSMPAHGQFYLLFLPLQCTNHNSWNSFHATCLPFGRWASAVYSPLMRQEIDVYTSHTEPSVSERTCHGSGGSSPAAEEAMGQAALRVFRLSTVRIIAPPVLHTHLQLSTSLITRTRGRSLGTFQQSNVFCFSDIGETEMYFRIAFSTLRRYDADGYDRIRCEMYCRDQQLTF